MSTAALSRYRRLVVKVGSSLLVDDEGHLDRRWLETLADDVAALQRDDHEVLIVSSGAGAETRMVIGIVILSGVLAATVLTLFIVPVAYSLLSRNSSTPEKVGRILKKEQAATGRSTVRA